MVAAAKVELYVKGLWDAMHGWGTDEYTLTALVCTLPENLYDEIHGFWIANSNSVVYRFIGNAAGIN